MKRIGYINIEVFEDNSVVSNTNISVADAAVTLSYLMRKDHKVQQAVNLALIIRDLK